MTEDQLEQLCIDWFKELGREHERGYDIAPDGDRLSCKDYKEILHEERM